MTGPSSVVWGNIRSEYFKWKEGDPLPISPIDGHQYELDELLGICDGVAGFARK